MCPKGQLISNRVGRHRVCNLGVVVSRIVTIEPGSSGAGRGEDLARQVAPYHSLTWRLEVLRENRMRSAQLPVSRQYSARADECRTQAESFRDPKARAQVLQLAASYDCKARLAGKFENSE